ncbi:MAG: SMC-Scp complex subunit ScpB [Clostridiales bacterium]|nr:SMC-Scp complex subunit ScpB [Clostridiales bacterium]
MDNKEIESAIEAILFAAGEPIPASRIALVLGISDDEVHECAKKLSDEYSFNRRGIRLARMGDSLQLCSAPEFSQEIVRALERRKPPRLSQPALEVLSICAYFQPVTRAYVDQIRGVDSSYTMGVLLERGLIEACGKLDVTGRPSIYRTTELFLRTMGISDLSELPKLPEAGSDESREQLGSLLEAVKAEEIKQMSIEEN